MMCLRCAGENYVTSDDLIEALLAYNVAMADVASGDSDDESYRNQEQQQQQQQVQTQRQQQKQPQQQKDVKQTETNINSSPRIQQHRYCVGGDVVDAAATPASVPSPVTAKRKRKNNYSSGISIGSSNTICICSKLS